MRGLGRIFKRGSVYWIAYYPRGKEYRESTESESESQARKLLKKRLGEMNAGRFIPNEDRLSFEDMVEDLENDYKINGKRSLSTALFRVSHVRQFFGLDRAADITPDRVRAYQAHRLAEGAANGTVNREVTILSRMLSLAYNGGQLSRKPRFQMLEENNIREGVLDHGSFLVLLDNLADYLKPLMEFLYLSGWRIGEAINLKWSDVDLEGKTVRLRIAHSKNKESRLLPLTGRLWELIQQRCKERRSDCPYVFHRDGKQIKDCYDAWRSACIRAGLGRMELQANGKNKYVGPIPHDFRRCAVRNLDRAGVSQSVAMQITGHKTPSIYRRYRIVDERDLKEATEKLQAHLAEQPKAPVIIPIIVTSKQLPR